MHAISAEERNQHNYTESIKEKLQVKVIQKRSY